MNIRYTIATAAQGLLIMNFSRASVARSVIRSVAPRQHAVRALHSSLLLRNKKIIDDDIMDKASAEFADGQEDGNKWKDSARKAREESEETRKRTNRGLYITLATLLGGLGYFSRPFDEEEALKHSDISADKLDPVSLWNRAYSRTMGSFEYFKEPIFEKLLPDPVTGPYGRPMTLVLSLDDLLVRHSWTRKDGWRTAKRPGVDYFLGYLSQYYEVVLFTDKYMVFDQDTVQQLDPYRASVSYALFREACRYEKGQVIKDLSHLNRDLTKVVAIDTNPESLQLQPENALILPKWNGNKDDTDLIRLLNVLEYIATQQGVKDVRPMLRTLQRGGDPLGEFEHRDKIARETLAARGKQPRVGGLMGMSSRDPTMTPQDVIRQRAQRAYAAQQKYIEEQGKKMLEEEKKLMEEHSKTTLSQLVSGGGPTQEELEEKMKERLSK